MNAVLYQLILKRIKLLFLEFMQLEMSFLHHNLHFTGSAEALYAVDIIVGKKRHPINYLTNPAAIYTYPEIASIGYTENQLKKKLDVNIKAAKFPFTAIAKAHIDDVADGFVKY